MGNGVVDVFVVVTIGGVILTGGLVLLAFLIYPYVKSDSLATRGRAMFSRRYGF